MLRLAYLPSVASIIAGCSSTFASLERPSVVEFRPRPDGTFEYRAKANFYRPDDSPAAEVDNLRWLGQIIEESKFCVNI
jgi:hypothetical protein